MEMSSAEKQLHKPKSRWFQLRLRTLLVFVTLASGAFGWVGLELDQRRREKVAIAWVVETSGDVYFAGDEYNGCRKTNWWITTIDAWLGKRAAKVVLRQDDVSDLSLLTELKSLESIACRGTNVSDLSPLVELKSLESFTCRSRNVSDPTPLAELKNLKLLSLSYAQVSDLSPLAHLKNLERVFLTQTAVSDLSPLAKL